MRQILFHKSFPQCCGKFKAGHFYAENGNRFFTLPLGQTLILRENTSFSVEKCSGKVDNPAKIRLWKTPTGLLPRVKAKSVTLTKSLCKSSKMMM